MATFTPPSICRWCGETQASPCMNTRDMEDRAVEGEGRCFSALDKAGGGERGIDRVAVMRERAAMRENTAGAAPESGRQ